MRRTLRFETLENRSLLAGNVTASVTNGMLVVAGDSQANVVSIETNQQGSVLVKGFSDGLGVSTKVNGTANGSVAFNPNNPSKPFFGVDLNMTGGNDIVRVTNVNLQIVKGNLGAGNDAFILGTGSHPQFTTAFGAFSGEQVSIVGDTGDDTISQSNVNISNSGKYYLGAGNDRISFSSNVQYGTGLNSGDLVVEGGDGSDTLTASALVANKNVYIKDTNGGISASLQENTAISGSLYFSTGKGNDKLIVNNSTVGKLTSAVLGEGIDWVYFDTFSSAQLTVRAGYGDDRVELYRSNITDINIYGGDGDDTVYAYSTTARRARFQGNVGTNDIYYYNSRYANTFTENPEISTFETKLDLF